MIISWHDITKELKSDWGSLQKEIRYSNDKLKKNYLNLDPMSFVDFHLVVSDQNEIEAFAGVQQKEIWNGFKRIGTRLYIRPKFRKTAIQGSALDQFTKNTSYTSALLHHQLNQYKKDLIFLSRECTFRSFKRFMKIFDLSDNFVLLNGFYRVCGLESTNPACIQKISVNKASLQELNRVEYLRY